MIPLFLLKLAKSRLFWGAIGVALLLFAGYRFGVGHEQAAQAKRVALAQAKVKKTEGKAQEITTVIYRDVEAKQAAARIVYRDIIKEVPRYVTVEADAKCVVPVGFVRLHDAAAAGRLPGVAGSPGELDRPSGVALSDVSRVVVDNYHTANDWRTVAEGWQAWYQQQKANHDAK